MNGRRKREGKKETREVTDEGGKVGRNVALEIHDIELQQRRIRENKTGRTQYDAILYETAYLKIVGYLRMRFIHYDNLGAKIISCDWLVIFGNQRLKNYAPKIGS